MWLKKISRSLLIAADGVVEIAETWNRILDHPVRSAKVASQHLLMSRPPLLVEEGNDAYRKTLSKK